MRMKPWLWVYVVAWTALCIFLIGPLLIEGYGAHVARWHAALKEP